MNLDGVNKKTWPVLMSLSFLLLLLAAGFMLLFQQNVFQEKEIIITTGNDLLSEVKAEIWNCEVPPREDVRVKSASRLLGSEWRSPNLKRIESFTVNMSYGVDSTIFVFVPKQSNNLLMIYAEGHKMDMAGGLKTVQYFVEKNYSVMLISQPLYGPNSMPEVFSNKHQDPDFKNLLSSEFNPLRFWIEPASVGMSKYAEHYDSVYMMGISGGGLTTTLYAAIDPRIKGSYPVAGSLPIDVLGRAPGHFEENLPGLSGVIDYRGLYFLGAFGKGRRQVQILNFHDPCCFGGDHREEYVGDVRKMIEDGGKGGFFGAFIDYSHSEHAISEVALDFIDADIQGLINEPKH